MFNERESQRAKEISQKIPQKKETIKLGRRKGKVSVHLTKLCGIELIP